MQPSDTAYPRFKTRLTQAELEQFYTPTEANTGINCGLQSIPHIPYQPLRIVRAERALSTAGGLLDYVLNVKCRINAGYRSLLSIYEAILTPSRVGQKHSES